MEGGDLRKITLLLIGLMIAIPVLPWGFFSHRHINEYAIFTLPPDMISFFKKHKEFLYEHAVDADKRKFTDKEEAPKHYIDMEYYVSFNAENNVAEIPRSYYDADSIYSLDSMKAWGYLPWVIKSTYYNLRKAFEDKDESRILRYAADLGHYVSDGHVPLHTTVNYNGQLTNQKGIHGLWETSVPKLSFKNYELFPGKAKYVDDLDELVWSIIMKSHSQKDSVLDLERQLTIAMNADKKYFIKDDNQGVKKTYSNDFVRNYEKALNGMVERKMQQSIHNVGSLWYTAWVDAGQPNLDKIKTP